MSTPVRLAKVEEKSFTEIIIDWILSHPKVTFILLFIVLAACFGLLFNVVYGMCTIESGVMRNFLNGGV